MNSNKEINVLAKKLFIRKFHVKDWSIPKKLMCWQTLKLMHRQTQLIALPAVNKM